MTGDLSKTVVGECPVAAVGIIDSSDPFVRVAPELRDVAAFVGSGADIIGIIGVAIVRVGAAGRTVRVIECSARSGRGRDISRRRELHLGDDAC